MVSIQHIMLAKRMGKNRGGKNMTDDSCWRHININNQHGLIYFLADFCFLNTS